jgi:hypothetical protein
LIADLILAKAFLRKNPILNCIPFRGHIILHESSNFVQGMMKVIDGGRYR